MQSARPRQRSQQPDSPHSSSSLCLSRQILCSTTGQRSQGQFWDLRSEISPRLQLASMATAVPGPPHSYSTPDNRLQIQLSLWRFHFVFSKATRISMARIHSGRCPQTQSYFCVSLHGGPACTSQPSAVLTPPCPAHPKPSAFPQVAHFSRPPPLTLLDIQCDQSHI